MALAAVWLLGFDNTVRERYWAFGRQIFATALSRGAAPV